MARGAQPGFARSRELRRGNLRRCAAKIGGPGPTRTDTSLSELRILSPLRLPVPPRGRFSLEREGRALGRQAAAPSYGLQDVAGEVYSQRKEIESLS